MSVWLCKYAAALTVRGKIFQALPAEVQSWLDTPLGCTWLLEVNPSVLNQVVMKPSTEQKVIKYRIGSK